VIRSSIQRNSGRGKAAKRIGQQTSLRIENRKMVKSGESVRGRTSTFAFPSIQTNVMVVSAGTYKRRFISYSSHEFETENATVKIQGAIEIRNFEVHVPDPHTWVDGRSYCHGATEFHRSRDSPQILWGLKLFARGALFSNRKMSYSIEKQIEEWVAQQGSDDLPGKGKPLDLDEYFRCPEDLRIGYYLLKNAGYIPEEVEQLREINRLIDELDKCADPAARTRLQSQLNETRVRLNLTLEAARRRRRG
jgi:hypothetical protein